MSQIVQDERVGLASPWSQRHVAFSANLGTFGLCDGLITPLGKAHRAGSVIVNRALSSPARAEDARRDCLANQGVNCCACMKRCLADAITADGHDKVRCMEFVFQQIPVIKSHYGIDVYACGLCQTGVPCTDGVPRMPST